MLTPALAQIGRVLGNEPNDPYAKGKVESGDDCD